MALPGRSVTLVLCTPGGEVLGALAAYDVATPFWQDVADVVAGAKAAHGVDVTILRVLDTAAPTQRDGGPVTYLAEVDSLPAGVALRPYGGDVMAHEPLRAPYANPGGPRADLEWAYDVLRRRDTPPVSPPTQLRTWNLSSIWRIPTTAGPTWLKAVPAFFGHEGELMARLDPAVVPPVLGVARGRLLLGDVAGEDQYAATGPPLVEMVQLLVGLQVAWAHRLDELVALGVADMRADAMTPRISAGLERSRRHLRPAECRRLDALVAGLSDRHTAIGNCGIPHSLVHGDFHPGNVRGAPGAFSLLDWGDSAIGHPMLDQLAFCGRLSAADREQVEASWAAPWRLEIPGCDAGRAAALLRPVAALCGAVTYQHFLDSIEPDERRYHVDDPVAYLRRAVRLAEGEDAARPRDRRGTAAPECADAGVCSAIT